jgi:hypothetical protein
VAQDLADKLAAIADLVRAGSRPALRRSLAAHHRRRDRLVGEIVEALVPLRCG